MKLNLPLLKLFIKLTILLILFVILFMISAILYSARYWPDVYNYINANITIKRIHSLSEMNLTILTVNEAEYTTEIFYTTDVDCDDMTTDTLDDSADEFEDFFPERKKRQIKIEETNKDYVELPRNVVEDYVFMNEYPTTEIIRDLVDERKLITKDLTDVEMFTEVMENGKYYRPSESNGTEAAVFPWIASVYVKNGSSERFDYFCDGALLSHNVILTAARCVRVYTSNATLGAENLIIIVGKRSLQTTEDGERVQRVKQVSVHPNFTSTNSEAENDLAILVLEEPVTYSSAIQAASLPNGEVGEYGESFTSGWAFSGTLTAIRFDTEKTKHCNKNTASVNTFCATYDNDVTTCPSYGGLYVTELNHRWTLQGLRTGDPADRSFCIDKTVVYTSLINFVGWIIEFIDLNKDY